MKGYKKKVTYHFEVDDETWAILNFDEDSIEFEETNKNGQEDTHIWGDADLGEDGWVIDKETREMMEMYRNDETASAIEAFFNKYGVPQKTEKRVQGPDTPVRGLLCVGLRLPNEPDFVPNDEEDA